MQELETRTLVDCRRLLLLDLHEELVQVLPNFIGQHIAQRAGVLARESERGEDRSRVVELGNEEVHDITLLGAPLARVKELSAAGDIDERQPAGPVLGRQIEQQIGVDADEARRVLGTLKIAREPIDIFCNP